MWFVEPLAEDSAAVDAVEPSDVVVVLPLSKREAWGPAHWWHTFQMLPSLRGDKFLLATPLEQYSNLILLLQVLKSDLILLLQGDKFSNLI